MKKIAISMLTLLLMVYTAGAQAAENTTRDTVVGAESIGSSAQVQDAAASADANAAVSQGTNPAGAAKSVNDITIKYVDYLFKDGFRHEKNQQKIYELSAYLTPEQRQAYYDENQKNAVAPFLLNLLLGFGIGSFVQGDVGIGHLQLWGDIVGDALMITGTALSISAASDGEVNSASYALIGIGSLLATAVNVVACIRPWFYAPTHNEKLRKALRVEEQKVAVSVQPVIVPASASYGLAMQLRW